MLSASLFTIVHTYRRVADVRSNLHALKRRWASEVTTR